MYPTQRQHEQLNADTLLLQLKKRPSGLLEKEINTFACTIPTS